MLIDMCRIPTAGGFRFGLGLHAWRQSLGTRSTQNLHPLVFATWVRRTGVSSPMPETFMDLIVEICATFNAAMDSEIVSSERNHV